MSMELANQMRGDDLLYDGVCHVITLLCLDSVDGRGMVYVAVRRLGRASCCITRLICLQDAGTEGSECAAWRGEEER